jgi:hypothetical protein
MRRFESTPVVRLVAPGGEAVDSWVAESVRERLAGLALLRELPPGRGLLLPRCRSVHTVGMRFDIDVAFIAWPPVRGRCRVLAWRPAVRPMRVVAPRGLARGGVAALEARAGVLHSLGPGAATVTFKR